MELKQAQHQNVVLELKKMLQQVITVHLQNFSDSTPLMTSYSLKANNNSCTHTHVNFDI